MFNKLLSAIAAPLGIMLGMVAALCVLYVLSHKHVQLVPGHASPVIKIGSVAPVTPDKIVEAIPPSLLKQSADNR